MKSNFLKIITVLLLASCSVAPINTTTTARTLGKDKNMVTANASAFGFQYSRGFTEKLDATIAFEDQFGIVLNAYVKYNIKDGGENGVSFAPIFGLGYGSDLGHSKSIYAGGVLSYRKDNIEPFINARLNFVNWKINELSSNDVDNLVTIPSYNSSFAYGQTDLGLNFYVKNFMIAGGARLFIFPRNSAVAPFADISYKF